MPIIGVLPPYRGGPTLARELSSVTVFIDMTGMSIHLHHIGIIVAHIDVYLADSPWELRGEIVTDPLQQARLCLVGLPGAAEAAAELVEPLGEESRLWGALQRGAGPHHVCFGVQTMAAGDALLRRHRFLPVTSWEPAVLFSGRPVRFAYSRQRELIEVISDEIGTR
jgi:hypothetical protein